MKKSIYIVLATFSVLTILSHVIGCGSTPEPTNNIIESIETLPTGECIYSVYVQDTTGYTFIDSCGKYKVGEQF